MTDSARDGGDVVEKDLVQAPLSVPVDPGSAVIQAWQPIDTARRDHLPIAVLYQVRIGPRVTVAWWSFSKRKWETPTVWLDDRDIDCWHELSMPLPPPPDDRTNASDTETVCLKQNCTENARSDTGRDGT